MKKIAIVYDRVNKWGGAERVLLALHEIFPKAPLYTSVYDPKRASWAKVFPEVKTSFLQKLPFAKGNHELFAPLMPLAFKSLNFSNFDLVISVTSEAAKNIRVGSETFHICYCLTPTRYLWSGYKEYFRRQSSQVLFRPIVNYLRRQDKLSAKRPDAIIAISKEVKNRIKKYYRRKSVIIYPPVNLEQKTGGAKSKKHYLVVSRLVNYKKVDLVIEAFNKLNLPLIIVGTGREEKGLKSMSKSKKIKFVGKVSEKRLANYYRGAKALIMPQEEDFGIVSVEAQSYGVPVIAYKKGGALDTVIQGKTGLFFDRQTPESIIPVVQKYDALMQHKFKKYEIIKNAKRFSKKRFKKEFLDYLKKVLN